MLRKGLIVAATLVLITGLAALASGILAPSYIFMGWAAFFIAIVVFERFRYKRLESRHPGAGWERTTERFVDEETGKMVTVYIKPETGERAYVAD